VNGPVYEAVDLVRTRHVQTDKSGGFVFAYLSHERGVQYSVTACKEGFVPVTVSGASPPAANHKLKLRTAANE
jgi:hypothetical protein